MPKINTTPFKEGDVIRKSDITSVADEIEAIDLAIDEENLREEGLDRRVFAENPWTQISMTPVEIRERVELQQGPSSTTWSLVRADGSIEGGVSDVYPTIRIPWNTLNDSDVIIRCSFFIESAGSDFYDEDGLDDASVRSGDDDWEFGLHVTHPDQSPDAGLELLEGNTLSGGIWPYARIGLCKAFQRDSKKGGDGSDAPGAWYQHAFTKQSQISQSVTLVYHAHCRNVTESIPGTKLDRSHVWDANGSAKVSLAYRQRSGGIKKVYIRGFNLSYQKFRR